MTDFAKAETQAIKSMRIIDRFRMPDGSKLIASVGTHRNYQQALTQFAQWIKDNRRGDLRHSRTAVAQAYLAERSKEVAQKTLDLDRHAIQCLHVATGVLQPGEHMPVIKSEIETKLEHRAYTPEQVQLIVNAQNEANSFSTQLAYACGLRAHELLTIRRADEKPADIRHYADGSEKNLPTKFAGREGVPYTVTGKGGLIREIRIPADLSAKLETLRTEPHLVVDRGVRYKDVVYDIAGGQKWSNSVSAASKRALGWSTGAHGLRHSYAQERMRELQTFCSRDQALETVSQEMGHFRADITLVYMR